jgi:hypothetical protein
MLVRGGRCVLLWRTNHGRFQRTGKLADLPDLGPRMQITAHVQDGGGSNLIVTPEGEAVMIVGEGTLGLLRAKVDDLMK